MGKKKQVPFSPLLRFRNGVESLLFFFFLHLSVISEFVEVERDPSDHIV